MTAVGLLGVATLMLNPIPESLLKMQPELAGLSEWSIKLLGLLNPAVLLFLAAVCGALLAHRVGLRSLIAGTAGAHEMRRYWWKATVLGAGTGVLMVVLDLSIAPWLGPEWEQFLRAASQPTPSGLLVGVLYGGVTEEILMRWGLISTLAWGLWALTGKRRVGPALMVASLLTAAAFGAAHLPALAAQIELNDVIVMRTLFLNGVAALVYAWVYWRFHLEAAMVSHASSHLAMGAAWALMS